MRNGKIASNSYSLDPNREIIPDRISVDTRPLPTKMWEMARDPTAAFIVFCMLGGFCLAEPIGTVIIPWLGIFYFLGLKLAPTSKDRLPLRAPIQGSLQEYKNFGDPKSGVRRPSGIFALGYEIQTNKELWISNQEAREHLWVTGTTGSGKTEFLMSIMLNCLSWGSGFIMIDGKGDISTAAKIYAILRILGRTDDYLLLNFMTGAYVPASGGETGHSTNPFGFYSQPQIMQVIDTMLPTPSGDGAMWQGRAVSMLTGVVTVLVWLRDQKGKEMSIVDIREGMGLEAITRMAVPDEVSIPLYKGMPADVKSGVLAYLSNLAGYPKDLLKMPLNSQQQHQLAADPMASPKFADQTNVQHGFLTQQLSLPFSILAENYRSIFGSRSGDVDMFDVVLNRRCLVVLLPALGKSLQEMENLGKITVATLKTVLGNAVGSQVQGTLGKTLDKRITNSPSPMVVIMDEVTYYVAGGLAMLPAQGRSLGFSFVFAVQSLAAVFKRHDVEGRDIFGTVNSKITMFAVDENETIDSAKRSTGEGLSGRISGYESQTGLMPIHATANQNVTIERMDRVTGRDIRSQVTGEFFYNRGDTMVRSRSIYIDPASINNPKNRNKLSRYDGVRLTHFMPIPQESEEEAADKVAFNRFCSVLEGKNELIAELTGKPLFDEIATVQRFLTAMPESSSDIEKSCVVFAGMGEMSGTSTLMAGHGMQPASPENQPDFLPGRSARRRNNQISAGAGAGMDSGRLVQHRNAGADQNVHAAAGKQGASAFQPLRPPRRPQLQIDETDLPLDITMNGEADMVKAPVMRALEQMDAQGQGMPATPDSIDLAIRKVIETGAFDPETETVPEAKFVRGKRFPNRPQPATEDENDNEATLFDGVPGFLQDASEIPHAVDPIDPGRVFEDQNFGEIDFDIGRDIEKFGKTQDFAEDPTREWLKETEKRTLPASVKNKSKAEDDSEGEGDPLSISSLLSSMMQESGGGVLGDDE